MSISKIEQLIEDIFDFVENSKTSFTNPNKVTIHRDELYDMLDELRLRTPEEIKKCQKIIINRNNILEDAEKRAAAIIAQANSQAAAIIDESEMVKQANERAEEIVEAAIAEGNRIVDAANRDAEEIRISAITYTNNLLTNAEGVIQNAYKNTKSRYDLVFDALKEDLTTIAENKRELERDLPKVVADNSENVDAVAVEEYLEDFSESVDVDAISEALDEDAQEQN